MQQPQAARRRRIIDDDDDDDDGNFVATAPSRVSSGAFL
jgi:hypothetical protein